MDADGFNGLSFSNTSSSGLSDSWGSAPGLGNGYDTSPGYGFTASPSAGFAAPNYSLGGDLGQSLSGDSGMSLSGYMPDTSYGLSSLRAFSDLGNGDGQGVQVNAAPLNSAALGVPATGNLFSYKGEPDFWGSKAQKTLSALAQFNPVTSLLNAGLTAANSTDPVKAVLQGLLGKFGGPLGQLANTGYNVATAADPGNAAAKVGLSTLGGQVGGALAGAAGAQLGGSLLSGLVPSATPTSASYGVFGSGSPVADMQVRLAAGQAPATTGAPTQTAQAPGGRSWTDSLMSLASGYYGMKQADAQRALAQQAVAGSAPWTSSGGNAVAGDQLKKVIAGDFTGDAGYSAAEKAAARASAQQPGGFSASAAAQAALKYQNERIAALGSPAGVGFSPASGYQTALAGTSSANALASASLGSVGFGTASGTQMPPWLQAYLVKNGLGGTANG